MADSPQPDSTSDDLDATRQHDADFQLDSNADVVRGDPIDAIRQRLVDRGIVFTGKELGSGSFAIVEEAHYDGESCALKLPKASLENTANLQNESQRGPNVWALTSKHDGLVTHIDSAEISLKEVSGDRTYLVTFWELGTGSLDELIGKVRTLKQLGQLLRPVAQAIDFLNAKQVFHRDVKPANIILFGNTAKLGDLGTVRVVTGSNVATTFVGTAMVGPPELISGGQFHDSIDLYCFATTCVMVLASELPYGGHWKQHNDQDVILDKKSNRDGIEKCLRLTGFDDNQVGLLLSALDPNPLRRPPLKPGRVTDWLNSFCS